jgi:hypothetical protein
MLALLSRPALVAVSALVALVAIAGTGCGSSAKKAEAEKVIAARDGETKPLEAEERFVERTRVADQDVADFKAGTPQRAFAEYWRAVDLEDYGTAVLFLSDRLRRQLDAQYLPIAFANERQNDHPLKPLVRGVRTVRGQTTLAYYTRAADGKLRPTSVSMERDGGQWYISFSPTLGESYGAAVQQAVQADIDPSARTAGRRAQAAGSSAARAANGVLAPTPTPGR